MKSGCGFAIVLAFVRERGRTMGGNKRFANLAQTMKKVGLRAFRPRASLEARCWCGGGTGPSSKVRTTSLSLSGNVSLYWNAPMRGMFRADQTTMVAGHPQRVGRATRPPWQFPPWITDTNSNEATNVGAHGPICSVDIWTPPHESKKTPTAENEGEAIPDGKSGPVGRRCAPRPLALAIAARSGQLPADGKGQARPKQKKKSCPWGCRSLTHRRARAGAEPARASRSCRVRSGAHQRGDRLAQLAHLVRPCEGSGIQRPRPAQLRYKPVASSTGQARILLLDGAAAPSASPSMRPGITIVAEHQVQMVVSRFERLERGPRHRQRSVPCIRAVQEVPMLRVCDLRIVLDPGRDSRRCPYSPSIVPGPRRSPAPVAGPAADTSLRALPSPDDAFHLDAAAGLAGEPIQLARGRGRCLLPTGLVVKKRIKNPRQHHLPGLPTPASATVSATTSLDNPCFRRGEGSKARGFSAVNGDHARLPAWAVRGRLTTRLTSAIFKLAHIDFHRPGSRQEM